MNIYVDESGSFVSASNRGAWNVVAAFVTPESCRQKVETSLNQLKIRSGQSIANEVKLNQINEPTLISFLADLKATQGLLFCTATDAGINTNAVVAAHKGIQVAKIRENMPHMKHQGGRLGVEILANQVEAISNQLYVQLLCQVNLLYEVLSRSINYYAQRIPGTLSAFRWRIDQKNTSKIDFEDAFEKIAPILLQSKSIRQPMPFIRGFNYSKMKKYEFPDGKIPEYLEEDHGLKIEDAFNVQKVIRDDIKFVDSKKSTGVQVADILASATRRCLRGDFQDNEDISKLLGSLMVQRSQRRPPIELICFDDEVTADHQAERSVRAMHAHNRSMLIQ